MIGADAGLRFWLRYVEAEGGLTDHAGDSALAVLPTGLQALHKLPEELAVTDDPDVAREDGVMFLAAGHPVLGQAADDVLAQGDVGRLAVPVPATLPPETSTLLERAREQFPVGHGRIDATGAPTKGVRPVLRVGALVSYTLSAEDHYQERAECWVDVSSRREVPGQVSAKLAALPALAVDGPADLERLTTAIGQAHRIISAGAEQRRTGLSSQVAKTFDAELERAEAYYRDVLATITRRRENAPADRIELLDARAEATGEERARRLAEIREKFQPAHEIRPYRLHLLDLPVWRLPVDVRRGDRRYPLTLDWLLPVSRFAEIRCPHCDAAEPLVAGKTRLGCEGCLAKVAVQIVPDPPAPARKPAPPAKPEVERPVRCAAKPRAADPHTVASPADQRLSPAKIAKAGDKLYRKLWDAVVSRDRRVSRMCAPDSPAAALRICWPRHGHWNPACRGPGGQHLEHDPGGFGGAAGHPRSHRDGIRPPVPVRAVVAHGRRHTAHRRGPSVRRRNRSGPASPMDPWAGSARAVRAAPAADSPGPGWRTAVATRRAVPRPTHRPPVSCRVVATTRRCRADRGTQSGRARRRHGTHDLPPGRPHRWSLRRGGVRLPGRRARRPRGRCRTPGPTAAVADQALVGVGW